MGTSQDQFLQLTKVSSPKWDRWSGKETRETPFHSRSLLYSLCYLSFKKLQWAEAQVSAFGRSPLINSLGKEDITPTVHILKQCLLAFKEGTGAVPCAHPAGLQPHSPC